MKLRKRIIPDENTFSPILRYEVDFEMVPLEDSKARNAFNEAINKDENELIHYLESFSPEMIEDHNIE